MKNNSHTFCYALLFLVLSVVACNFNFGGGNSAPGQANRNSAANQSANSRREQTPGTTSVDKSPTAKTPASTVPTDADAPSETAKPGSVPGGQSFVWQGHGVSIVVPSNWKKRTASTGQVSFGETRGASISVDEVVAKPGPITISFVTNDHNFQQSQLKAGKVEEAKYLIVDGVRGSYARSAAGDSEYDMRKISWKGFRTYQGRPQAISVLLLTTQKEYAKNRDIMEQVLYNIKFTEE